MSSPRPLSDHGVSNLLCIALEGIRYFTPN